MKLNLLSVPATLFWLHLFWPHLWFLPSMFLESSKEQFASTNIAEELVRLFQKQTEHEKKEMIFEVLAPLAENGNFAFILLLMKQKATFEESTD